MSFTEYLKDLGLKEKVDRLYLEKCQEVNRLTEELRKLKEAQSGDLISRAEAIKAVEAAHSVIFAFSKEIDSKVLTEIASQYDDVAKRTVELISKIPAVSGISAAERLHEEVEELWQEKSMVAETMADMAASAKEVGETIKALWREYNVAAEPQEVLLEQTVTTQDILCLSSALRNLYEIHKCDGWLLYNRLSKVLDKAIEDYSGKVGVNE